MSSRHKKKERKKKTRLDARSQCKYYQSLCKEKLLNETLNRLIARCKELNISQYPLNKNVIVNKILNKMSKKPSKQKAMIGNYHKSKLNLIKGYIRRNEKNYVWSNDLIELFIKFFGDIYFKFDICYSKNKYSLKRNGTIITINTRLNNGWWNNYNMTDMVRLRSFFVSSFGFNDGINKWKIKFLKLTNNYKDQCEDIGIISDINCLKQCTSLTNIASNAYFLSNGEKIKCSSSTQTKIKGNMRCLVLPQQNDIIEICLNCNQWTISFWINHVIIGKHIPIHPNCTYYPIIASKSCQAQYQLLYR